MDFKIHCIETEAYGAVLRAFIAQSEALSWEKEALITELRKELRVSDVEHREILGKISLDGSIKSIREWRKGTGGYQLNAKTPPAFDPMVVGQVSCKRLKLSQRPEASSPKCPSRTQPSPNPVRDGQWNGNTAVFSPPAHVRYPMIPIPQNGLVSTSGKVKGSMGVPPSKNDVVRSGPVSGNMIPEPDIIEIRATDKLINEVEKMCGGVNPDRGQVEKARLVLREHEKSLVDAIRRLTEVSDGGNFTRENFASA